MSAMQLADKTVCIYSFRMFISVTPLRKNGFRREQRDLRADAQICGDFCILERRISATQTRKAAELRKRGVANTDAASLLAVLYSKEAM